MEYGKKITIDDVAEALGVSKTTVSRAISGKGRISPATKEKVSRYIEEHNYTPNVIAKGLAQSRTFNICVVLQEDYNLVDLPFFQRCLLGIIGITSTMDYDVLVCMVKPGDISQLERIITNHKVDGVILTRTLRQDRAVEYLLGKNTPFVTIGSYENDRVIQVDNDHLSACRELTSVLLMKGMKRIALIGGNEDHVVTQNRLKGYITAHEELSIQVDAGLIYMNAEGGVMIRRIVETVMRKGVDCIICMDDSICAEVLNIFRKEDILVPSDIRLASFYHSTLLENNSPAISSLKFDVPELGMTACRSLLDRIEGKETPGKVMLGYEVILKESTK